MDGSGRDMEIIVAIGFEHGSNSGSFRNPVAIADQMHKRPTTRAAAPKPAVHDASRGLAGVVTAS